MKIPLLPQHTGAPISTDELVIENSSSHKTERISISDLSLGVNGRLTSITTLTTLGAGTYTVPSGIHKIFVRLVGGGGGGGAADGVLNQTAAGNGGSAGGYLEKTLTVVPGTDYSYFVGAGGPGGTVPSNNGSSGTSTTFDGSTLTGTNGDGGAGGATGTTSRAGTATAGGVPTGGDVNIRGGSGEQSLISLIAWAKGGRGGESILGAGGMGNTAGTGFSGLGYGSGGGGGGTTNATDRAGGDGAQGIIIIQEYS